MAEKPKTRRWDIQEHLKTEEERRLFLEACFKEGGDDPAFIACALDDVARARRADEEKRFLRNAGRM
jgi:DNA-binding phage protein